MGASYQRTDTGNNISNGNVINADDLDAEFNAIEAAFSGTVGHSHDGTTGEGGPILQVGPAQDLVVSGTQVLPKTDNTLDLGSATFEFKDLYVDGTANIDALVADTADINGGTIDGSVIGGATPAAATFTTANATTVNATTVDATNVEVTNVKAKDGTASIVIADTTGDVTIKGTAIPNSVTLVSEAATQTLTNKTVNLTSNTLVATSAQLAAAVTDETGTGALVFAGSPALTGTPTAPTAAQGTNTTQLATTAHVVAERTATATLTNKTLTSPAITGGTLNGGDPLTVDSTELNLIDGLTVPTAKLNVLNGVYTGSGELEGSTLGSFRHFRTDFLNPGGSSPIIIPIEQGFLDATTSLLFTYTDFLPATSGAIMSLQFGTGAYVWTANYERMGISNAAGTLTGINTTESAIQITPAALNTGAGCCGQFVITTRLTDRPHMTGWRMGLNSSSVLVSANEISRATSNISSLTGLRLQISTGNWGNGTCSLSGYI